MDVKFRNRMNVILEGSYKNEVANVLATCLSNDVKVNSIRSTTSLWRAIVTLYKIARFHQEDDLISRIFHSRDNNHERTK